MITIQVTIGASATRFSTTPIYCRQAIVQNNAANVMRIGDVRVSTSRGAALSPASGGTPGGSVNLGPFNDHPENLANWWVAGTQNDVLDIIITG